VTLQNIRQLALIHRSESATSPLLLFYQPGPVALRASSMLMHVEAIRAGTGRGVLPCYVGDGHPLLERLTPPIPEIAAEYWIIVHRDLRRAACVRAVIGWVKALLAEQRDVLAGNR
jgi:DNA-binding transcriptional LysR family regulator